MTIKEQIISDIKDAMKAKQQDKLRVLRSLKAKLMEKEISERKDGEANLTDEQAVEVLMKAAKQRKESIEQFEDGDREDLAENEKKELKIIEAYLPEMMDEDEVRSIVKEKIEALGASGMQDMGKVMGPLMGQLKGKADGSMVSRIVKEELGG
ncbi:MAG: GatB/YqeY domain-containing protein [Gracilimonas sp.]|uniref:GatB/YqeY domain-containing protein n=1 Tax=Gracilimonas TaxID=649462 RepID=UPI001B1EEC66|nr:GatB/YqeY domain-containing protein [Gracilimonas sp.]MBO6584849.1 GatB/YqeY domain-containing protein [Gracilimonas sp.]MBO6615880.1 GatB/YqeY domain-containing protein [Gracilimonas sp.]